MDLKAKQDEELGGQKKTKKIEGDNYVKKKKNVEDKLQKSVSNVVNLAEKNDFDPMIHSIKSENMYNTKKRFRKRDKQKKEKRKAVEKEIDYLKDYHDLLLENLSKETYSTKSPHLVISRKWFFKIKNHSIMVQNTRENSDGQSRQVYYDIETIGSAIKYIKKGNEFILNPSTTSRNTIFIVVRLIDLRHIKKLQFHTGLGHMIQKYDVDVHRGHCYVILSIINVDKKMSETETLICDEDLPLLKRFYINQIAIRKGNYHFGTTGTIYGLGYGPKSNRNEYGHSVCKFSNRKLSNFFYQILQFIFYSTHFIPFIPSDIEKKKTTTYEKSRLSMIDDNMRHFAEYSINRMCKKFAPVRKSISPLVDKLQVHLDVFPDKKRVNVR